MEGFNSGHSSKYVVAVGDKDVKTVDDAARLLLESFVSVDEKQKKVTFKLGSVFETGSTEIIRNFTEGRHLAVLKTSWRRKPSRDYWARTNFSCSASTRRINARYLLLGSFERSVRILSTRV